MNKPITQAPCAIYFILAINIDHNEVIIDLGDVRSQMDSNIWEPFTDLHQHLTAVPSPRNDVWSSLQDLHSSRPII